jgi:small subunit ribosomal protein S1
MNPWDWDEVKRLLAIGTDVEGVVTRVAPFGVFVDLGVGFDGVLEVPQMAGTNRKRIEDYPAVGARVTAKVITHQDRNKQVYLTQRG